MVDIISRYKSGERDFRYADLSGAKLRDADLSGADLRYADLSGADLRYADLMGAKLRDADLSRVDLDMSCLPLWCGSLGIKVDKRIAVQIAYHLCALDCDDPEYREVRSKCLKFANQMHRTDAPRLV